MESLHDLLVRRHSIRRYTDQAIDAEDVKTIMEAALLAPTSKSKRSWQFVLVEDKGMLEQMAACRPAGAQPIARCKLCVVICADRTLSDMWLEDSTIAATFIQLQATALGLGACWIQVRGRETADGEDSESYMRDLLGIPHEMGIECVVTIGHPDEERRPVDTSKLLWEKVHADHWTIREE